MSGVMKPNSFTMTTWSLLTVLWCTTTASDALAERLSRSDLGSTLEPQCEFCWYPAPPEAYSSRLPTYRQQRPRRPPGSRPQRYPKGRYKLEPAHKQTTPTTLRTRSSHAFPVLSTLNIRVLDGDTFRMGAERIRLRNIDTPELAEPEGLAAKQRLEQLLHTGPIHIVSHGRDVYRRLLADVFVSGERVVDILRREGFAKADSATHRAVYRSTHSQSN